MWRRTNPFKKLGELSKYEKVYDWKDVILYNSYCLDEDDEIEKEKGVLSNFYSECSIPFNGKTYHSSEQLYFYRIVSEWGKDFEEYKDVLKDIMSQPNGRKVKNSEMVQKLVEKIEKKMKKDLGVEKYCIKDWKLMYECLCLKYKYCEKYRDILEKYKHKYIVEDSCWGDVWAGCIWDKAIGKYRGCNVCGRAIMLVYKNRVKIMGEG